MADRKVIGESPDINFLSGTVKPGPYTTSLAPADEFRFQGWVEENRAPRYQRWVKRDRVPWRDEPKADYDMRGFWKAQQAGDPRATTEVNPYDNEIHFSDVWKTPHHESFSRESMYATPNAPTWHENRFLKDKLGRTLYDAKLGRKVDDRITIRQMQR